MRLAGALSLLAPPLCFACGGDAGRAEPLCPGCRGALRWLDSEPVVIQGVRTWAPVAYEGPARALVAALKFRGAVALAGIMAAQMAANAPPSLLSGAEVVPVPLHPGRLRRRGFNQAVLLARALSARTGLPVADCLERSGDGGPQVGRGRQDRLAAIDGTVHARPGRAAPRRALLVDDVVTTGATLSACARALRSPGRRVAGALAYARTEAR